jgi:hypothetical protein
MALIALHMKYNVERKIKLANEVLNAIYNATVRSENKIDYYNYNSNGSIAVSVPEGRISYVRALPNGEICPPAIINRSEIVKFYYYDPGVATTKYYGCDLAIAQRVHNGSVRAEILRGQTRGLHIETSNLDTPKIIISLNSKEADHWRLILKKLIDQNLEPVATPRHIP